MNKKTKQAILDEFRKRLHGKPMSETKVVNLLDEILAAHEDECQKEIEKIEEELGWWRETATYWYEGCKQAWEERDDYASRVGGLEKQIRSYLSLGKE